MTPLLSTPPCPAQPWRATSVVLPRTHYKPETWRSGRNKEQASGRGQERDQGERPRLPGTKAAPSCLWAWKTSDWVKPQSVEAASSLKTGPGRQGQEGLRGTAGLEPRRSRVLFRIQRVPGESRQLLRKRGHELGLQDQAEVSSSLNSSVPHYLRVCGGPEGRPEAVGATGGSQCGWEWCCKGASASCALRGQGAAEPWGTLTAPRGVVL